MLKHVIMWQLKDELSDEEKAVVKKEIKEGLEGLNGKIEGLEKVEVRTDGINNSSADVLMIMTVQEEAFERYSSFPEHKRVAVEKIRPFVKNKMVMDYTV